MAKMLAQVSFLFFSQFLKIENGRHGVDDNLRMALWKFDMKLGQDVQQYVLSVLN